MGYNILLRLRYIMVERNMGFSGIKVKMIEIQ
jgi:hypothetical protein